MGEPSQDRALRLLARACGIQGAYLDADGRRRRTPSEALTACLQALGIDPRADPRDALAALRRDRLADAVVVTRGDERPELALCPGDGQPAVVHFEVRYENGEADQYDGPSVSGERVSLPFRGPHGYHEIVVASGGRQQRVHWIAAPRTAHPAASSRAWGLFMPTYALRSDRSAGGVGDLADLRRLMDWTADRGGATVSTLPLLATVLEARSAPSPYRPDSRLFWNETYLALDEAPLLAGPSASIPCCVADEIDFHRLDGARRAALDRAAERFFAADGATREPFHAFLRDRPEVLAFARFRAARERYGAGWRHGGLERAELDPIVVRRHAWAQWACEVQLDRLLRQGRARGVELALDMPVGVHPDGYDAWRYREQFVPGVSVGAPPDTFFVLGQDWGLPAPHPFAARRDGHRYFAACLRQHMRFASVLRIDHVMALHRLFWVPEGFEPAEGAYVHYPSRELYAVLALESSRSGCAVVGEDLGTVPAAVRPALARQRMRRTVVLGFDPPDRTPPAEDELPADAVACLGTHDMPMFAGWWQGRDLDDRLALGLVDAAQAERERDRRRRLRDAWAAALQSGPDLTELELLRQWLTRLARSRAGLTVVQLEDLWLESRPQNVPGTSNERPNFRRPSRETMERFVDDPQVAELLRVVDRERGE